MLALGALLPVKNNVGTSVILGQENSGQAARSLPAGGWQQLRGAGALGDQLPQLPLARTSRRPCLAKVLNYVCRRLYVFWPELSPGAAGRDSSRGSVSI